MNSRRRFKLSAGAGLVTMLLGGLMVAAPGAGAELVEGVYRLPAGGGPVPLCHATNAESNPYIRNEPNVSATGEFFGSNHASHLGPVFEPGMKAEHVVWGDIIPPISVDGVLVFAGSPNWTAGGAEQYAECTAVTTPQGATLVVEKDVPGETDDPTTFSFTVGSAAAQEMADGGWFETGVAAGSVDITEAENAAYALTDVSCTRDNGTGGVLVDDEAVADTLEGGTATITAVAGDIITCVFTNTPKTDGLTVVKKNDATADGTFNTAESVNTAGLPVKFQVDLTNTGNQPLTIASLTDTWSGLATPVDVLAATDLACTRATVTTTLATALPAGSTTTCTFTLPAYSPAVGTSRTNEVTATAGNNTSGKAESTVTTTGTVIIPEVLSEAETPTETPTPAAPPDVEVKGVQTVRALPRTGDETRGLAGVGALMLAVGAAMVLGSKRQLARR